MIFSGAVFDHRSIKTGRLIRCVTKKREIPLITSKYLKLAEELRANLLLRMILGTNINDSMRQNFDSMAQLGATNPIKYEADEGSGLLLSPKKIRIIGEEGNYEGLDQGEGGVGPADEILVPVVELDTAREQDEDTVAVVEDLNQVGMSQTVEAEKLTQDDQFRSPSKGSNPQPPESYEYSMNENSGKGGPDNYQSERVNNAKYLSKGPSTHSQGNLASTPNTQKSPSLAESRQGEKQDGGLQSNNTELIDIKDGKEEVEELEEEIAAAQEPVSNDPTFRAPESAAAVSKSIDKPGVDLISVDIKDPITGKSVEIGLSAEGKIHLDKAPEPEKTIVEVKLIFNFFRKRR